MEPHAEGGTPLHRLLHLTILGVKARVHLMLGFLCVLCYWPLSLNLFTLKGDAIIYFLPNRYAISNSLRNGEFPFWSPYLYMGSPIHADMQSGAWNPFVWLFSLFTRYNMSVLHAESLLYIFLGGIGIYKLLQEFGYREKVKLAMAVSYLCCGFVTGSAENISWLASAAFVPFVFLNYYRSVTMRKYADAVKCGFSLYLLLVTGYPSFLIYTGYILLFAFAIKLIGSVREKNTGATINLLLRQLVIAAVFCILSLPALLSYLESLPFISRAGLSLADAQTNAFCGKCSLSFLIPFDLSGTNAGWGTDATMRNGYAGIFAILFLVVGLRDKIRGVRLIVLVVTLLSLLFSLGDATPVREYGFRMLPLMNYFRHPGNMRLFTSIGILFLAAGGMQTFLEGVKSSVMRFSNRVLMLIAGLIVAMMAIYWNHTQVGEMFHQSAHRFSSPNPFRAQIRDYLAQISLAQAIFITGVIQLLFILLFLVQQYQQRINTISWLVIANMILLAQLSLPSTVVSARSPAPINRFIGSFPAGFPFPDLTRSLRQNASDSGATDRKLYGDAWAYNKKIVIPSEAPNPTILKSFSRFLHSGKIKTTIAQYPLMYLADTVVGYTDTLVGSPAAGQRVVFMEHGDTSIGAQNKEPGSIVVKDYGANGFRADVFSRRAIYFNVAQCDYKHWTASVGGKRVPISRTNIAFMSIRVPAGTHQVLFRYDPDRIRVAMYISVAGLLAIIATALFRRRAEPVE